MLQLKNSYRFFSLILAIVLLAGLAAPATPALASPPPPDPPVAPRVTNPPAGAATAPLAAQATLTVTNVNDGGAGSLRANINAATAGDTIIFDSSLAGQVIVLTTAQLDVTKSLTIDGTALASRISISGNKARRVFNIYNNATLTLKGVAVINGVASDGAGLNVANGSTLNLTGCLLSGNVASNFGGGVYNYGTLKMSGCTVTGNQGNWGGGVENRATLAITDTTFITNTALSGGGGAETYGGTVTIARSAFINNSAYNGTVGSGGGFQTDPGSGDVLLTNVTFSGNQALGSTDDGGGALMSYGGTLYLTNVTMLNNSSASHGGGISTNSGYATTIYLKNSIISGNTAASATAKELFGTFISQDYNLIGSMDGATLNGSIAHNITGQNPGLNTLANNGGSTASFAVLPGSLVLGFIPNGTNGCGTTLLEDQRSQPRPANYPDMGGGCDIGAFELQADETFSATLSDGLSQTFGATLTTIQDHAGGSAPGLTMVTRYAVPAASLSGGMMPFTVQISPAVASGLDIDLSLCFTDYEASLNHLVDKTRLELYRNNGSSWERIGFNSRTYDAATGIRCVTKNNVTALSEWTLHDPNYPTAVTLAGFTATTGRGQIMLTWQTLMEIDTLGFNLYRSLSPDSGVRGQRLNEAMIPATAIGSVLGQSYEFVDYQVQSNVFYYYWLEAVNLDETQLFGPQTASLFIGLYLPVVRK